MSRRAAASTSYLPNKKRKTTQKSKAESPEIFDLNDTPPPSNSKSKSKTKNQKQRWELLSDDKPLSAQVREYLNDIQELPRFGEAITTLYKNLCGEITTYPLHAASFSTEDSLLGRFIDISVLPSLKGLHNLARTDPEHLTLKNKYLVHNHDNNPIASTFFMTGVVSFSQLITPAKIRTGYQVCIQPLDITWTRILDTITTAIDQEKVFMYTYSDGIPFSTYGSIKKDPDDDGDHNETFTRSRRSFPVRGALPVDVIDGTNTFTMQSIRSINAAKDLPKSTKELRDWTPILVTCTIAINDWDPKLAPNDKEGPKSPSKKKRDGFTKSVSFNLQNIVELGPPGEVNEINYENENDSDTGEEDVVV